LFQKTDLTAFQNDLRARLAATAQNAPAFTRLAFHAAQSNWLVDIKHLSEVVEVPPLAPVPLTQRWFLGLANVRGNLHCVIDFVAFSGGGEQRLDERSRLLLISNNLVRNCALLVSSVSGLRNPADFSLDEIAPTPTGRWIAATHTDTREDYWHELDLPALVAEPRFVTVVS
jgi:twitching motility protein PilI